MMPPRSPSLTPFHVVLVVAVSLLCSFFPRSAHADPRGGSKSLSDSFADGDVDAFDALSQGRARLPAERFRGLTLTLVGSTRQGPGTSEQGGTLVLGLPFDALLDHAPSRPLPTRALYTDTSDGPRSSTGTSPNVNVVSTKHELRPPSASFARAVVLAAERAAGVGTGHARIDELASRARTSGLLPEARFRATRYVDDRASADALAEQSRLSDSSSQTLGLEARLTFRLDRLIFADEEPQLERTRLDVESFRTKLAQKTLELLFRLHRARVEVRTGGPDAEEASLTAAELEASLDALTGGWFSRQTPNLP